MQFFKTESRTELESAKQFAKNCEIARQKVGKIIRQFTDTAQGFDGAVGQDRREVKEPRVGLF
jgi:hypothetical protein